VPGHRPNVFFGSYDQLLEAMDQHIAVDIVLAPKGRLRNMRLERRLRDRGVDWRELPDRETFLQCQQELGDLGYCGVGGFSWRISQSVIDASTLVINCHPGDLLVCRGPQPLAAALIEQHATLGACVHIIDSEAMDSGPLLARELMQVDPTKGYSWHKQQLMRLLADAAAQVFSRLAAGQPVVETAWAVEESHWHPQPEPELLKRLYMTPSLADFYQRSNL
jgi:methionyl-tRNA formyltransferase